MAKNFMSRRAVTKEVLKAAKPIGKETPPKVKNEKSSLRKKLKKMVSDATATIKENRKR